MGMPDDELQRQIASAPRRQFQFDRLFPWLVAGMGCMLVLPFALEALEGLSGVAIGKALDAACWWLGANIVFLGLVRVARLPRVV